MNNSTRPGFLRTSSAALIVFLAACGGPTGSPQTTTTTVAPSTIPPAASTAPPPPTTQPQAPLTTLAPEPASVVLVTADDVLNVRGDPDPQSDILGTLAFDATGVPLTGEEAGTNSGVWKRTASPEGWVNSFFLTGPRPDDGVIEEAVSDFAAALGTAADLRPVVDDRGLFVISFDQPKRFAGLDLAVVMDDETLYPWGSPACSPDECPNEASFAEAVAQDFLDVWADDDVILSFNEPISAPNGTVPEHAIPDIFTNFGYVAVHDPGDNPEFDGLDWTTWYVFVDGSTGKVVGMNLDIWAP